MKLLCRLGLHEWYKNPEVVRGYGKQEIHVRGCKRDGCFATQFKEGNGKWKKPNAEKFREWLFGAANLHK